MRIFCVYLCLATLCWAQIPDETTFVMPNRPAISPVSGENANIKYANLREDNESTRKDVKDLILRVEQLERENAALQNQDKGEGYATKAELKLLEARMNDAIAAEGNRVESVILEEIKAAKKVTVPAVTYDSSAVTKSPDAAPAKPAKKAALSPAPTAAEKDLYLKEGVLYTVQPGDTLTGIAKKNNSSVRAIMVANDIVSPNKLYVGKELFVPTLH